MREPTAAELELRENPIINKLFRYSSVSGIEQASCTEDLVANGGVNPGTLG